MQARYPHLDGRTGLCYSECGKYLFTCGDNGMIRRFLVGSPQIEPESTEILHNGLDVQVIPQRPNEPNQFIVCCDDGEAEIFNVETLEKRRTLFRTALPLRELSISHDGMWCLLTGDDKCLSVRIDDITETRNITEYPAKHASFHPSNSDIVAVSTLDGTVRVLQLSKTSAPKTLTDIEMIVPSVKSSSEFRSTAAKWCPQGEAIALPSKTFEICVVSTKDWLVSFRLMGHTNAITALEWSPNGRYVASCAKDNRLLVFDTSSGGSIADHPLIEGCELKWHPYINELSATTAKGQLYVYSDIVPSHLLAPSGGDYFNPIEVRSGNIDTEVPRSLLFLDDADKESGSTKRDAEDDRLFMSSDDDLAIEDKTGDTNSGGGGGGGGGGSHSNTTRDNSRWQRSNKRIKLGTTAPAQHAFQSGSTPWIDQRRYMCMCPTGYVWSVRQDSSHNTVTISFFDQSNHREVHFQDSELFDLASLTDNAAVLANSRSGEVHVRFHSMLADNWNVRIDTKVDGAILGIAISKQVVAVFTKHGFLRTYTVYGSPLDVFRIPSNMICCAAGNENEFLYVCHNQVDNTYSYTFLNLAVSDLVYQKSDTLDITPNSQIRALFFSDEGEPCVMDSNGMLSTLLNSRKMGRAKWVPILGNPATVDQEIQRKYWPIGVSEDKLLCVVLRGQAQYPSIPLPITDEIKLSVPGCTTTDGEYLVARTLLQQAQSRVDFLSDQGVEQEEDSKDELEGQVIEVDKMLLRQFQQACENHRVNRALLLVQLIQGQQSLEAAAQVASAYELTTLADRINEAIE